MSPLRRLRGIAALSAAALATTSLAGPSAAQGVGAADECQDEACAAEQATLESLRELMAAQGVPQATIDQTLALYAQMGLSAGDERLTENVTLNFLKEALEGTAAEAMIGETEKNLISGAEEAFASLGADDGSEAALVKLDDLGTLLAQMGYDETAYEGWPAKWYSDLPALIEAFGGEEIPDEVLAQVADMYAQLGIDPADILGADDPGAAAFLKVEDPGEDVLIKIDHADASLDDVFAKLELDPGMADGPGGALTIAEAALAQAAADGDIDQATLEAILRMLPDE